MFISAGRPVLTECQSTLADGLAVPMIGANAFATAAPLIDKVVIVRLVLISQQKKENNIKLHLAKNLSLFRFCV
jgi:threonine dehydratase